MNEKIIIIGSGVVGIHAATKLIDGGYPGELITIVDAGKDPYNRPENELMKGYAGCGLKSDGKLTRSIHVGGQLSKYCGEKKAYQLMDEVIKTIKRFHPEPNKIIKSEPTEEPDFIKPYFNLRLFPVWHIGTDYLDITGKNWYNWLVEKKVNFSFDVEITDIDFENQRILGKFINKEVYYERNYDKLIYATGKSGIDLTQKLIKEYNLPKEKKSIQIGVRFEAPQHYFQKLIDLAYDFKLYQKPNDKISLRSFCVNNDKAYVAIEETYGDISFNGHAKKDEKFRNNMTNFGIIMEIKDIENPFEWCRELVKKCQHDGKGLFYSPNKTRKPSLTAEGKQIECLELENLNLVRDIFQGYFKDIENYINDLNKIFQFGNDWAIYLPEVKYLSEEVLTNYKNLSLINYSNIHFAGDSLSSRGIVISGCHGLYIAESLLNNHQEIPDFVENF